MYENLYFYHEEINGKSVYFLLKPNFREAIALYDGLNRVLSDGEVSIKGRISLDDTSCGKLYPEVYVSENAQWALDDTGYGYTISVTEWTKEITTPLGAEWNTKFNMLLKKCKSEYYQMKKREVRLYFYEASSDKLKLCYLGDYSWPDEHYSYPLKRVFPTQPYCAIDKMYAKPDKDCFILGKVRKTIGLKNSKLLDFIEPVHRISLDFEKDEYDFGGYEYEENKEDLEKNLFDLLKFSIAKKHDFCEVMRIRAYLQNNSDEQEIVISQFKNEIWKAFEESDVQKIRQLYMVLNKQQDCTNVKFELRLKEDVTCGPERLNSIYFVNGESKLVTAQWIYENINNCIDASGKYLGVMINRYNFY